ncbi:hypothetical protein LLS1_18300 [Leifsonia sp. LS1]|nr:hypothetical protein LLS1_18300 [Leifsonia sp. LS1]
MTGGLSLAALAAMGVMSAPPAWADSPLSFNQVKNMALGEENRTLSQVKADLAVTGPWASFNGEWCAWFVTWLLHNNGIGYEVGAQDPYDTYKAMGRVGTKPTVGALIFFDSPASHVGLVIGTNGSVCETVEGNAGGNPWSSSVVHHNTGRSGTAYAYPVYADQDSSTTSPTPTPEDDMTTMELVRQDGDAAVYFSVNRIIRYHITAASLTDYQFWLNQLKANNPYANPNVQVVQNVASFGAVLG